MRDLGTHLGEFAGPTHIPPGKGVCFRWTTPALLVDGLDGVLVVPVLVHVSLSGRVRSHAVRRCPIRSGWLRCR